LPPGSTRYHATLTDELESANAGSCEPHFRGGGNSPALMLIDRLRRFIKAGAGLHFSKDQKLTSACDDIDFAQRASPAPRENAESPWDQKSGGAAFGRDTDPTLLVVWNAAQALRRGG
jgi:hypothetical protein